MPNSFDVIIIGTGFGGAVTAARLAEKGMKVLVLERGREWETKDFPRGPGDMWLYDPYNPEEKNGWWDFRLYRNMPVWAGAGVGGGSLHYANVSLIPPKERFNEGWPPEITYDDLLPYYEKVGEMLELEKIPENQLTQRYGLMKDAADNLGYKLDRIDLAVKFNPNFVPQETAPEECLEGINQQGQKQGTCVHCGDCIVGCKVLAKNTLDLNYIPLARKHGAEVRPLHLVKSIKPENNGYRVFFDEIDTIKKERRPGEETAHKVILSAGSLGSTEILLKCRDKYKTLPGISKRLGYDWSANGNFLTPAFYDDRTISPTKGPSITAAIDFLDGSFKNQRFTIEEGGFPPLLSNYLLSILDRKGRRKAGIKYWKHRIFRRLLKELAKEIREGDPLSNVMPWFANGVDAGDGRLKLGRLWYAPCKKRLKLSWNSDRTERLIDTIIEMHGKLTDATDGKLFVPPTWKYFKALGTPHPLGGCKMGSSSADGVVDHRGQVFGYPNLYVADGAILTKAIGLNPSRTIAAFAERNAGLIN